MSGCPTGPRILVLRLVLEGVIKPALQRVSKLLVTNSLHLVYLGPGSPVAARGWILLVLQENSTSPPGRSSLEHSHGHG